MPLHCKAYRSDLMDQERKWIKRLVPRPAAAGRPQADDREVINSILYVTWTGFRWDDLIKSKKGHTIKRAAPGSTSSLHFSGGPRGGLSAATGCY